VEIFSLIIIIILAICSGIITGLIPGLHINFISILILINFQNLTKVLPTEQLIIFIIIMSLTHTFIDFIPSMIFGIPNADTAMSILPGQQMILKGEGYKAILLSNLGSLSGVITSAIIGVLFYYNLETLYTIIQPTLPYILAIIVILGIFLEPNLDDKFRAIILILFTGGYGIFLLNSIQLNQPLLILFTGVFANAAIINSLLSKTQKLPPQNYKLPKIKEIINKSYLKSILNGAISSSICSITPAIGNIQAATISTVISGNKNLENKTEKNYKNEKENNKTNSNKENFISLISLINTNNFVLSLITFLVISKARNGSIFVISQIINNITITEIIKYYLIILITTPIIFYLTLKIGKFTIKKLTKLDKYFKKINFTLLILLTIQITLLESYFGLLCLFGATLLGYLTIVFKIKRIHLLSALIVPTIINLL
jgi:putative membrane protein